MDESTRQTDPDLARRVPLPSPAPRRDARWGFFLFVGGAFAFLTVARVWQPGMFSDGLLYASISRNLAQGIGSFWFPSYSSTDYPVFLEHPPLAFGLQAAAFLFFGDHLFVERGYALVMGAGTGLLVMMIWGSTVGEKRYGWLPLVFWLLPSTVTWVIVNNMLENTQALFTTMAMLAVVRSAKPDAASYRWSVVGGVAIIGAVLTKGPTGLFPVAGPILLALVMRERAAQVLRAGVAMTGVLLAGIALILWSEGPRQALSTYWHQQVISSVSGMREHAESRWVLWRHLKGVVFRMTYLLAVAWIVCLATAIRKHAVTAFHRPSRWVWFFLLAGMSASLPIAVSPKIMGSYLVPSIPMYALGFAGLVLPVVRLWLDEPRRSRPAGLVAGGLGCVFLAAAVALPLLHRPLEPRDSSLVAELQALPLQRGTTIGSCRSASSYGAYLQRFFQVSVDSSAQARRNQFLHLKTEAGCAAPAGCRLIAAGRLLALFDCAR